MADGELTVRRFFEAGELDSLAEWVCEAIRSEPHLSRRGEREIRSRLRRGEILVGFLHGRPAGFIFRIHLAAEYWELAGWLVRPELRTGSYGRALLEHAFHQAGHRYIFFTFRPGLFRYLKGLGARRIRLADLPWPVAARLLGARFNPARLISILQFKRRNRVWILGVIET